MDDLSYIKEQLASQSEMLTNISASNAALFKKVSDLQLNVRNLEVSVIGNENLGFDGLVKRVKVLEEHKRKITDIQMKMIGAAGVGGVLWTLLLKFWDRIFGT